jgi:signal transduction histidine kinase/ActR/RegA family two-component response regulator
MRRILTLAFLFAAYVLAAKLGLSFASVNPSVSAIWPPTGIALGALLVFGRDLWPAILAGAFVANLTTAGSIATSIGIAIGNTLEAVLGAYLVARFARGRAALDRPPDIFRFVAFAGMAAPMVSASLGVTSLAVGGFVSWPVYGSVWLTWWLGDMAGALLVTPLLLVWGTSALIRWDRAQTLEAILAFLALAAAGFFVFGGAYPAVAHAPIAFMCIPVLVWTAFRFGQRETAVAIVVLSTIAVWGTLAGHGPFAVSMPVDSLVLLQAFMGTVAMMAMAIAALVADQKRVLAAAQQAQSEAETANLGKDTFLAMLGHELRNPLAAITTAVHVLDRVAFLDAKASHVREIIAAQVAQLARLVDDLLDVTRVTTGKIVLHRTRADLSAVVGRSIETLAATGESERHQVEFHGAPTWVDVDSTRLEQVATNLLTNAFKYTPPGGSIVVKVATEKDQAVLTVKDTGIGIASEMLPRIFDLFTQGDRGPDRSQGGLGIGLTLVKRLVELHGGTIDAASGGVGRGSTFTVRLPGAGAARVSEPAPHAAQELRARRVIVVEDQADAREMLRVALQLAGHEVFEAADGPQAIEMTAKCLPEIAIVDIGLPGCDGYEVAQQVRQTAHGRTMFLMALTGYGQPEDRRRAEAAGFDLHLVKPVDPERLSAIISDVTERPDLEVGLY